MLIEINDNIKKRILELSKEYDNMLDNGANDYTDIGDDCIDIVCELSDLIKCCKNPKVERIGNNCLRVYHWEFLVDSIDEYTINVYEIRTGDVIGTLGISTTLPDLEKKLSNLTEDQVNSWIEDNIEYI